MRMNPLIPMAADVPDIAGNFLAGRQFYDQQQGQNALRQYGGAAMSGDQNALRQIAAYDPQLAMGLMGSQQDMEMQRNADARAETSMRHGMSVDNERLALARQQAREATAEHAARMSAIEREESNAALDRVLAGATQVQTPEQWDQLMSSMPEGREYVGQFENRDVLVAMGLGIKDALSLGAGPEPTTDMRNYQAAQNDPGFGEFLTEQRPQTTVSLPPNEAEYDKARGKQFAERAGAIATEAQAAERALSGLGVMEQAMQAADFYSGAGSKAVMAAKRAAAALGIDPEGVSSMETFNAMTKQSALDVMGGSLGTGFSNADRDFVIEQVPNLGNTPSGNKSLIDVQRKIQGRRLEIAKKAREYEREHGRIDLGFEEELAAWAEANPLFPAADMEVRGPAGGSTGTTGSGVNWRLLD